MVVEKSMGFGNGGWDIRYITYIVHQGKVVASTQDLGKNPKFLTKLLRHLGFEYKCHTVDTSTSTGQRRAERLFNKLLEETRDKKNS